MAHEETDDDISSGGLNPAGFTPNYGWPMKPGRHVRKLTPARRAFGWILIALMLAALAYALFAAFRYMP